MRLVLLGVHAGLSENRWKVDLAEGAEALGWSVKHLPARGIPADDVVRACRKATIFIWARTHNHEVDGSAASMLQRIEERGTATVGVHMDLYWGLPRRQRWIGVHPWWSCQYIFTADGGPRDWAGRGVNHHWLPPAVGPRFLGRGTADLARFPHPIVFVGGHVPQIHGQHRASLLGWAHHRYGADFRWYGKHRPVWGEAFSDLCASAQVVLGDSAPADRYWSDRTVLTLSRGGLLAHPRTEGMAELGFDEQTMIPFDRFAFNDLGDRVDNLTVRERREITDNALDVIRERHTWGNRLEHIAEVIAGAGSDRLRGQPGQVGQLPGRAQPPSAGAA